MAKNHIIVGLEIGTSKISVVVGESRPSGTVHILGCGKATSCGVRKGEIVDIEAAGKCIREALVEAEEQSNVSIGQVYLGVTGGHFESFNNRCSIEITGERQEIVEDDCEDLIASARGCAIANQNDIIHSILQHYSVDDQNGVLNPVGMLGSKLDAEFHIIHGSTKRIQNSIRCVKEVGPEVLLVAFNAVASAVAVLDFDQKNLGALVIDIGGGTTDYVVYVDGVIKLSGSLPVGGDHLNSDLSLGLRIPMARAEKLKIAEGSVCLQPKPGIEPQVTLRDDAGFTGKVIDRQILNTILHVRMREVFEILKRRIDEAGILAQIGAGVFLTGGASQTLGMAELASTIFEMPAELAHSQECSGPTFAFESPELSTAIGLLKLGSQANPQHGGGWFRKFLRKVPFVGMLF